MIRRVVALVLLAAGWLAMASSSALADQVELSKAQRQSLGLRLYKNYRNTGKDRLIPISNANTKQLAHDQGKIWVKTHKRGGKTVVGHLRGPAQDALPISYDERSFRQYLSIFPLKGAQLTTRDLKPGHGLRGLRRAIRAQQLPQPIIDAMLQAVTEMRKASSPNARVEVVFPKEVRELLGPEIAQIAALGKKGALNHDRRQGGSFNITASHDSVDVTASHYQGGKLRETTLVVAAVPFGSAINGNKEGNWVLVHKQQKIDGKLSKNSGYMLLTTDGKTPTKAGKVELTKAEYEHLMGIRLELGPFMRDYGAMHDAIMRRQSE